MKVYLWVSGLATAMFPFFAPENLGGGGNNRKKAEEEAQRLSKFNAEILGHNNPAQRIMYVDRIRRELHETKHVRPLLCLLPC